MRCPGESKEGRDTQSVATPSILIFPLRTSDSHAMECCVSSLLKKPIPLQNCEQSLSLAATHHEWQFGDLWLAVGLPVCAHGVWGWFEVHENAVNTHEAPDREASRLCICYRGKSWPAITTRRNTYPPSFWGWETRASPLVPFRFFSLQLSVSFLYPWGAHLALLSLSRYSSTLPNCKRRLRRW